MVIASCAGDAGANVEPARIAGLPDFIIVGAPKCGTTALYSYLTTHPDIAMSSRKEPYFWCPDVPIRSPVVDASSYAALWQDAADGALRGEATPAYLRSTVAAPTILHANPSTKFIVLLRSPADMAVSFHAQMLVARQEEVVDFRSAWHLQPLRARGKRLPAACFFAENLQYSRVCALGDQLERLMAVVPRAQLHVATLDELGVEPRTTYLSVLEFLGLDDDGRTDFPIINGRRQSLTRPPLRFNPRAIVKRVFAATSDNPRSTSTPPPLDQEFVRSLNAHFLPQVRKLELLLDRDFAAWKSPACAT